MGQDKVETIDVRVLAATNRDLKQEIDKGHFRSDLYHRLSVYPITVPPLRERDEDSVLLAGYFLEQARRKLGIVQLKLGKDAQWLLSNYNWPGNVRELEHVINRAALKARARCHQGTLITVSVEDIGELQSLANLASSAPSKTHVATHILDPELGLRESTVQYQRQLVLAALTKAGFNWAKAARALKTDRANLTRLAKRLGIQVTTQHQIKVS